MANASLIVGGLVAAIVIVLLLGIQGSGTKPTHRIVNKAKNLSHEPLQNL